MTVLSRKKALPKSRSLQAKKKSFRPKRGFIFAPSKPCPSRNALPFWPWMKCSLWPIMSAGIFSRTAFFMHGGWKKRSLWARKRPAMCSPPSSRAFALTTENASQSCIMTAPRNSPACRNARLLSPLARQRFTRLPNLSADFAAAQPLSWADYRPAPAMPKPRCSNLERSISSSRRTLSAWG